MSISGNPLGIHLSIPLEPVQAFYAMIEELTLALERSGISFTTGPEGRITGGNYEMGKIVEWAPGERISIKWHPASWLPDVFTRLEFRFTRVNNGTELTIDHHDLTGLTGDGRELAGWFALQVAAPFLISGSSPSLGDWLTDRKARRPSGHQSRAIYGDPVYHYPNFRVILVELSLTAEDHLLEIGCGGGVLLRDALRSGCRAAAIDHSPDMIRLAGEINAGALKSGRLTLRMSDAANLPFPDNTFSAAVMTGVLGFLEKPVEVFGEIRRVLVSGGRLIALGSDPTLRGTPGAPEPMASRLNFYEDDELTSLAVKSGFTNIVILRRNLLSYARDTGVPEEHLSLFDGETSFLKAIK
jgi:SAM-dependent methyltransferase